MKITLILTVLLFVNLMAGAQYFQTGQDPASIRWRQLVTDNFQLIYPEDYELQAQKLAGILEKVYDFGTHTLSHNPGKISVILHTRTVKSNGLVAWAPKRSEFYTTPHQAIYPQDWLEQLALHEFRHVVQVDKLESQIPGIIRILLGEQGTALIFGAYLPWWFIEGDAVVTETALSRFGRGRFPSFLMEHQAQVVQKGIYPYNKAYNGSVKDFVPNHYKLGYYLTGNARDRYGPEIWENVINQTAKRPLSLNPFNRALKKTTGMNKVQLYHSIFDSLAVVWKAEDAGYTPVPFSPISPENKSYASYRYNHFLNDSVIISLKTSLREIPAFVRIGSGGKETKIFHPGVIFDESVSYSGNMIVWSEQIPDPRWSHSGKSLIRVCDVLTGKITEIRPEHKAFSPAFSPAMDRIAVTEADFLNNYYLSVYSYPEGLLVNRIQTEGNHYLFSPEWMDSQNIAVIRLTKEGKQIITLNLETGEQSLLIKEEMGEIRHLKMRGDLLWFISGYTGKDCLYSLNLTSGEVRQVYEPRFGADSPAISGDGKKMVVSDYQAGGYRIIAPVVTRENTRLLNALQQGQYLLADRLATQEKGIPDLNISDTTVWPSSPYSKTANLINMHSWAPLSVNTETYEMSPGISLLSQNKLGTAEAELGYRWDYTDRTGEFYAGFTWKGWYPVIGFDVNSGKKNSEYYLITQYKDNNGQVVRQDTTLKAYSWTQTSGGVNIRIPMVLNKGVSNRFLQPEVSWNITRYKQAPGNPDHFYNSNYQSFSYRLYFQQLRKQSQQDVYPNAGIVTDLRFQHSPVGPTRLGDLSLAQTWLFVPGLAANHGIRIYAGIQRKTIAQQFGFSDLIRYPRGWGRTNTTEMFSTSADYKLPVWHPDLSMGGLAYLQRVELSVFGDYAGLKGNIYKDGQVSGTFNRMISSVGTEVTGKFNFLRFYAPATLGFRASYLPDRKTTLFDLIFSFDFTAL